MVPFNQTLLGRLFTTLKLKTANSGAIFLLGVLVGLVGGLVLSGGLYDIRSGDSHLMYKLNKLTGTMWFCEPSRVGTELKYKCTRMR